MSDELKRTMYEVASKQVESPSIEISVEGESKTLVDDFARSFALGVLTGLRAANSDLVNVEINLTTPNPQIKQD